MKKKVILLIGGQFQRNASLFIKNYDKLSGQIDLVLCLQPKRKFISSVLNRLSVPFVKNKLISLTSRITGMPSLQSIKNGWTTTGENSWDLMPKGIDIFEYAKANKIQLIRIPLISSDVIKSITKGEETIIIVYTGGILEEDLLSIPKISFINAHMGEMPRYRGMNVIEWAYLEGNTPKVSVMLLSKKIDGGDLIYEMPIEISQVSSIAELRKAGYEFCALAMAQGVYNFIYGKTAPRPQGKGARYYYKMHNEVRRLVTKKLSKTIAPI